MLLVRVVGNGWLSQTRRFMYHALALIHEAGIGEVDQPVVVHILSHRHDDDEGENMGGNLRIRPRKLGPN